MAMSEEITVHAKLAVSNTDVEFDVFRTIVADQTGTKIVQSVIDLTDTSEVIPLGEITSPGWCFLRNLDPTYTVEYQHAEGSAASIKLLPGEIAIFRMATAAPAAKTMTGTAKLFYAVAET